MLGSYIILKDRSVTRVLIGIQSAVMTWGFKTVWNADRAAASVRELQFSDWCCIDFRDLANSYYTYYCLRNMVRICCPNVKAPVKKVYSLYYSTWYFTCRLTLWAWYCISNKKKKILMNKKYPLFKELNFYVVRLCFRVRWIRIWCQNFKIQNDWLHIATQISTIFWF